MKMLDENFKEERKDVADRKNLHNEILAEEEKHEIEKLMNRFIEKDTRMLRKRSCFVARTHGCMPEKALVWCDTCKKNKAALCCPDCKKNFCEDCHTIQHQIKSKKLHQPRRITEESFIVEMQVSSDESDMEETDESMRARQKLLLRKIKTSHIAQKLQGDWFNNPIGDTTSRPLVVRPGQSLRLTRSSSLPLMPSLRASFLWPKDEQSSVPVSSLLSPPQPLLPAQPERQLSESTQTEALNPTHTPNLTHKHTVAGGAGPPRHKRVLLDDDEFPIDSGMQEPPTTAAAKESSVPPASASAAPGSPKLRRLARAKSQAALAPTAPPAKLASIFSRTMSAAAAKTVGTGAVPQKKFRSAADCVNFSKFLLELNKDKTPFMLRRNSTLMGAPELDISEASKKKSFSAPTSALVKRFVFSRDAKISGHSAQEAATTSTPATAKLLPVFGETNLMRIRAPDRASSGPAPSGRSLLAMVEAVNRKSHGPGRIRPAAECPTSHSK